MDLDLLGQPEKVVEIMCDAELRSRPGRVLAYHAVSGGFVLAEVVRRVTGDDIRTVLERELIGPLGYRWMRYGVRAGGPAARRARRGHGPARAVADLV